MNKPVPEQTPPAEPTLELPPEVFPNVDELEIEDGKPVDSIFVEKHYRLLTEPLYASWNGGGEGRPFLALSDVGLFFKRGEPPLVPDVMLSLDVQAGDLSRREHNSYFMWIVGKPPEVVIEIVSDRRGGEETHKLQSYARICVGYYVIFDPAEILGNGVLRAFELRVRAYEPIDPAWLSQVGLGLTLWDATHEDMQARWLRWCDRQGRIIPTGRERAERLLAQLRAAGIEPSE
jgi:hypothetical protein